MLTTLADSLETTVLVEDEHRRIRLANQAFCRLLHMACAPDELVGADCRELLAAARHAFRQPEAFARAVHRALATPAGAPLSVSVGLTLLVREDSSGDEAIRRADAALYAAKEAGRNRVVERYR